MHYKAKVFYFFFFNYYYYYYYYYFKLTSYSLINFTDKSLQIVPTK